MKQNDMLLINKMLQKVVDHDKNLAENRDQFDRVAAQFEQVQQWQIQIED